MKRLCLFLFVIISVVLPIGACKQGQGERCQVDADCADGLVCNKAKNTCQSTSGGDLDATVPDAPRDSPVDTPLD